MAPQQPLAEIPYVDIRGGTPLDLFNTYPERARHLAHASMDMFGPARHLARSMGLPVGDRISKAWLEKSENPYLGEIHAIADALGINGVYFLNVCFEWGCTSGTFRTHDGMALRRVLDWPFPTLGENVIVAHQSGAAGDFYNITWSGLSGMFQGMAPGRFAAAINQAPMRQHGNRFVGDWIRNRFIARRTHDLPPAHVLRHVFETAGSYAEAREILCSVAIAVPAIFILSGVAEDEGCIIERTETAFGAREMAEDRVCATNHFETISGGRWLARPIDSAGRVKAAHALSCGQVEDGFRWFVPPIANVNSRLVVNANAASGELAVLGTAGCVPTTEVFVLPRTA
jgi:hypothetical protein